MAESYTAGSLLVPVKPDARGAQARVRREFANMPDPVVQIDADISKLEKAKAKAQAELDQLSARKNDPSIDLDIKALEGKVAKAQARLEALRKVDATPQVEADIKLAEANVGKLELQLDRLNAKKADPKVDVGISEAQARLAKFDAQLDQLKAKRAEAKVDADTSSGMTSLIAFRAAAGRLVGRVDSRVDVDTKSSIVQLAALARALGMLALPAAIIGASPYLASLGASAVQAAGAVWLLPAALGAGAVAFGALKVATAGFGDAMKYAFDPSKAEQFAEALAKLSPQARATVLSIQAMGPALTAVRTATQDAFFAGLAPMLTSLAGTYLPAVQVWFVAVAGAVNAAARAIGGWLASAQGIGVVSVLGTGAVMVFQNLAAALAPLAAAFLTIGAIGMPILVQLTAGAGAVASRFASWVGSAQGIQTITGWIWNALTVLGQLWAIAVNVGSILGSIFAAGAASGESFLSILARVTGGLAAALKTPEGSAALTEFFTVVRGLVAGFVDKLVILWPALVAAGQALAGLLAAAGPLTGVFLTLVVGALTPLLNLITVLSPILGPMIAMFTIMRVVTAAWAAVQWVLNAALTANPIGLVILAVTALVAAVIYAWNNFDWFRNAVTTCWNAIVTAATWAWTTILQPIFNALWAVIQFVGGVVMWLWTNVFVPAWNAIAAVVSWAWTTILQPVFSAIDTVTRFIAAVILTVLLVAFQAAWALISAAVSFAWNSVILPIWNALVGFVQAVIVPVINFLYYSVFLPIWNAIGAIISFIWNSVILPIFNAHVAFLNAVLIPLLNFLYYSVFLPIWNAIGAVISFVWNSVILPVWNALVAFVNTIIIPLVQFLYNNVILPIWTAIGNTIMFVWTNVIKPAWDAVAAGLSWLGDRFREGTDRIGQIWGTIRGLLAKPINFMIDVVWNRGVVPAWNKVAELVGLGPIQPLPLIPEFAAGGAVNAAAGGMLSGPGTGTSDSMLARVSTGEFIIREAVASRVPRFLQALNDGQSEAVQAAGGTRARMPGYGMSPRSRSAPPLVAFAGGGPVMQQQIERAAAFARGENGKPYQWGGVGNPSWDCSGFMSGVVNSLAGRNPRSRLGTTSSMPWGGFSPGLLSAFAIGNSKRAGHMAGTLAGVNVESGGTNGVHYGSPAIGADNGLFEEKWHLPVVGGAFVSGGAGGGGGVLDWISPLIRAAFESLTNPAIDALRRLVGEPPPEWRRAPPALAVKSRDALLEFMLSKVSQFLGGSTMDVTGIGGPAVDQVREVARRMGWGDGPEWDAIMRIVQKESSWNPAAASPISSARGLFQKMTSIHGPVEPTPAGQAAWGLNYIKNRYGTPSAAWAFHQSHNFYDEGGVLPPGVSLAVNATGGNEHVAVFTTTQWAALQQVVGQLAALPATLGGFLDDLSGRLSSGVDRLQVGMDAVLGTMSARLAATSADVAGSSRAIGSSATSIGAAASTIRDAAGALSASAKAAAAPNPTVQLVWSDARNGATTAGYGDVSETTWNQLRAMGFRGIPEDRLEALYIPLATLRQVRGFDSGGTARGTGWMWKGTGYDEQVLDPVEKRSYDTLGPLVREMEAGRLPTGPAGLSPSQLAAMAPRSEPLSGEMRLTSGRLRFDPDGLAEIVDGRIELLSELVTDRK